MTAFAACLFGLAAFASAWVIVASLHRHGPLALTLRAQRDSCPDTLVICWKVVERASVPLLAPLRTARTGRAPRPSLRAPGLEWPAVLAA